MQGGHLDDATVPVGSRCARNVSFVSGRLQTLHYMEMSTAEMSNSTVHMLTFEYVA